MTNVKNSIGICFSIFIACHLSVKGEITVFRSQFLADNAACPKTTYADGYWVNVDSRFKAYEWKITGGSLIDRYGQPKDKIIIYGNEIFQGQSEIYVTVIWNNVASKDDKAPKGTITINAYKDESLTESDILDKGKSDQEIKSLKDMRPPSLDSSVSPPILNFGEQEVRVYLSGAFNFPGVKVNGFPVPVTKYEWQIPEGWQARTGDPTSSGTYLTSTAEIRLISDAASGGQVKVRGVNDCAGSGDYSDYTGITFTRKSGIEFLAYPQTVPLGEVGTYEFGVLSMSGVSFEWEAPAGWSINGGGNTYTGGNVVQITTSECPTSEKVKVSMVQGDDYSSWAEFPTMVALPAINIPSGEIKQYQPSTFSLDMPDDNIASVEWLVNGNSVGTATNTSTLSFPIVESGKVKISAKLTLEGCSPVSIPEMEVDVTEAPALSISGPSTICNQATYTIDLPQGVMVEWSYSLNILLVDNQNSTIVVKRSMPLATSGPGWISATVVIGGDRIDLPVKQLWVGIPLKPNYITIIPSTPSTRQHVIAQTTSDNPLIAEARYKWNIIGCTDLQSPYGSEVYFRTQDGLSYVMTLRVSAENECGCSPEYEKSVNVVQWTGGDEDPYPAKIEDTYLFIYPNPATDIVTVELQESIETGVSASRMMTAPVSGEYEIQLWSASAMLRRYTTEQPIYQISISGLPAGIYFVRVIKNGQTNTKKLIKK